MSWIFGIGFVILAVVFGALATWASENDWKIVKVLCGILCALCILSVPFIAPSVHTVDETEVCVVKEYGKVKEVVTEPGMFFDFWIGKSYKKIDTKTQELKLKVMAYSSDAQVMEVETVVQYNFLGSEAKKIIKNYGSTKALTERITSVLNETPRAILSTRAAMEIIANRSAITPEIREAARNAISENYPVEITNVAISNIDFSDAFEQAVEEKMIAEQNKLKADYENEKKVATAKANAEAKLLEAEAEAKSNELLEKSITDKTLRDKYLDKWDGKLPSTMVGDGTSVMVPAA